MLWDTFRSQNFGFHMITGSQRIAGNRRRSQKIEHGSIFCDRLRSWSQDRRRSQKILEECFHMIADDRRTFCDLRSAIVRDHMETSLYKAWHQSFWKVFPQEPWEVISTWFLLDCRKLTRSKLVKQFNCVDSNEEMTKQYMSDQLLTRRNNFLSYVLCQLFNNWVFLVFFLFQYQKQRHNFWGSIISSEVLDASLYFID